MNDSLPKEGSPLAAIWILVAGDHRAILSDLRDELGGELGAFERLRTGNKRSVQS